MKGRWQNIVPWTTSDAVNKGPQAKNALRVHTEGNVSTLFVNDKQIAKIKGVPWSNFHRNQLRRLLTISPSRRISLVQPMRFKPAA